MQDMIVSVYESQIINQQISYYILKEEYKNEKTGFVNEGLKEAGTWIKNKITAFIKLVKSWLEKLGNLIKRIFKWIAGAVNKVLVFLKLKKKPQEIDGSKLKESEKKKIKKAVDDANKAIATVATKKDVAAPPKLNAEDGKKYTEQQNSIADAVLKDFIDNYQEIADKEGNSILKTIYTKIISNAQKLQPMVFKMANTEKKEVTLFDTNLAISGLTDRVLALTETNRIIISIRNMQSSDVLKFGHNQVDEYKKNPQAVDDNMNFIISQSKKVSKEQILSSKKEVTTDESREKISTILLFLSKRSVDPINKQYNEAKKTIKDLISMLEGYLDSLSTDTRDFASTLITIVNKYMGCSTTLYREFVDFASFLYNESLSIVNQF